MRHRDVKHEKRPLRGKIAVSGRFYAVSSRCVDLLAGESCVFRFALDPGLLILNPVTPGFTYLVGSRISSGAVLPHAFSSRFDVRCLQVSAVLQSPCPSLNDFPNLSFPVREWCGLYCVPFTRFQLLHAFFERTLHYVLRQNTTKGTSAPIQIG